MVVNVNVFVMAVNVEHATSPSVFANDFFLSQVFIFSFSGGGVEEKERERRAEGFLLLSLVKI